MKKRQSKLVKQQRFGIRKFSVGAASVLVSTFFLSGGIAEADEQGVVTTATSSTVNSVVATEEVTSEHTAVVEVSTPDLGVGEVGTEAVGFDSKTAVVVASETGIQVRAALSESSQDQPVEQDELITAEVEQVGLHLTHHADETEVTPAEKTVFAVWTDKKGQDDLVWYRANQDREQTVPFDHHKEYGVYHVHTYLENQGKMTGVNARTVAVEQPKPEVTVEQVTDDTYTVSVTKLGPTISAVLLPIWLDKNGQDDVIWYEAKKKKDDLYQLTLDTKKHGSDFGLYHIHVYGQSSVTGGLVGLSATSFSRQDNRGPAQIAVTDYRENKTDFMVNVTNQSNTKPIKAVRIAVWSETKGQDDLKWYQPTVTAQGASQRISIANHSNTSDQYIVHVYTDYQDGSTVGTDLGKYKITKPDEKQEVRTQLTADGIALVLDSTTVRDYRQVRFAVWSDQQGQDDLKWYPADANGKALAHYTNHKGYGVYHIHTYENQNGKMVALADNTLTVARPAVTAAISPISATQYRVTVSNVAPYLTDVTIPVWSDAKGQDDLKWYSAKKQADGSYELLVSINDHQKTSGQYQVHIYAKSKLEGNRLVGISATEGFNVSEAVTDASIKVANHRPGEGTLDVVIESTKDSKTVRSAKVAVWSEDKQTNIKWYEGVATDGKLTLSVDERYHKYIKADYHVHTYVTYDDGTVKAYNLGNYRLEADKPSVKGKLTVSTDRVADGLLDIVVSDISPAKGLVQVLLPTWSEDKGQDDLKWYEASKQADGSYKATALLGSQHRLHSGKYNIHLYYRDDLGQTNFVTSQEVTIKAPEVTGRVTVSSLNTKDHTMTVTVDNVAARSGLNAINVAVWSDQNGQDDIQWYQAFREKDGRYQAKVHLSNHKYANGLYHVHTYYQLANGETKGVSATSTRVSLAAPRSQIVAELNELLTEYRSIFAGVPGQKSLYITPTDGIEMVLENDAVQRSASTIKLFVLASAYAKAERGELDLNKRYTVSASEIVSDSGNLASAAGSTYALRDIANFMIRTSDNTATNIMIKNIGGVAAVNEEIRRLGYNKTVLNRYMYDMAAINAGVDNYISAQEAGDLIKNIYNKSAVSPVADQTMLTYLANNYHTNWFPSQLKGLATTYDKPGAHASGVENDVAVIAKNGRAYVVSLLTQSNGGDGRTHTGKFGTFGKAVYNKLLR